MKKTPRIVQDSWLIMLLWGCAEADLTDDCREVKNLLPQIRISLEFDLRPGRIPVNPFCEKAPR